MSPPRPAEFCTGVYVYADSVTIERTPRGLWAAYQIEPGAGRHVADAIGGNPDAGPPPVRIGTFDTLELATSAARGAS